MDWFKSIRSLVTIIITATFCYMAIIGKVDAKDFIAIVMMVISFYFVTKKRNGE